jgi:hypothetical protein
MAGRSREPLAPKWEALRALVPDRHFQSGLSRFMSYCSAHAVAPEAALRFRAAARGSDAGPTSSPQSQPGRLNITAHRHPAPGAPIQDRSRLPLRSHDSADVCARYLAEFIQQSLHAASSSI